MNDLADCRAQHGRHPETFLIPDDEEIGQIQPGDLVKLIFDGLERMWVEICSRDGEHFEGRLRNIPWFVEGLAFGDRVCFHSKHICDIECASSGRSS